MPDLTPAPRQAFLILRAARTLCALPIAQIVEVSRLPALRTIETGVPALLGIAILRGLPAPVLDLATLLGFSPTFPPNSPSPAPEAPPQRIVSIRAGSSIAALAIEEVIGIRSLDASTFLPLSLPGGAEQILGVLDTEMARLLDASRLIPAEVWQQLETDAGPQPPPIPEQSSVQPSPA